MDIIDASKGKTPIKTKLLEKLVNTGIAKSFDDVVSINWEPIKNDPAYSFAGRKTRMSEKYGEEQPISDESVVRVDVHLRSSGHRSVVMSNTAD